MNDFKRIASECVAYFETRLTEAGASWEAHRHGAQAAQTWRELLESPQPDPEAAQALFREMDTHRRFRYWSVHWHYMAQMMNRWCAEARLGVAPIPEDAETGLRETYEQFGFVVVRRLVSPERAAQLKAEAQQVVAAKGHHAGVFVGLAANSVLFKEAIREDHLLDALETILGEEVEFLSDKVVYKSAETDFGSPWHQDWPYWKGAHKLSVWVALDAATVENGCLKLLPGSHKHAVEHHGIAPEGQGFGHRLQEGVVEERLAVSVPCAVGDAVFFHDLTLHASHPNTTGEERYAWIATYRSAREDDLSYSWAVAAEVLSRAKGGTMPERTEERQTS